MSSARSVRDSARDPRLHPRRRAPAIPTSAPTPERPYAEEVGADPGKLRIGVMKDALGGQFEVHPDCVAAVEEAAGLLESLGHSLAESYPQALDDPHYTERFIQRWTAGIAWNLEYWSRKTGKEVTEDGVEASTWALAEMGADVRRCRVPAGARVPAARGALRRRMVGWWVRPSAVPDDGRAADAAGRVRAGAGQPAGPDLPLHPDGRVHGLLELGRPARHIPAPSLDGGGPANRNPAGRATGARGRPDPGRRRSSRRRAPGPTGSRCARVLQRGNPFDVGYSPADGGDRRGITAMVTPFAEDRSVDEAAARRLARHLIENGSHGLVLGRHDGRIAHARRRREALPAARRPRRARLGRPGRSAERAPTTRGTPSASRRRPRTRERTRCSP